MSEAKNIFAILDELKGNAADLNKDGVVDAIDLLLQKRYLLGTQNINI